MTDDEIRDVFAQLHRIGVDLAKPPGLAIGTGFRDGELLEWLTSLPDALGHDAFAERLRERVNAAAPNAAIELPMRAGGRPHREWPTVEQLHVAADLLVREWDPLGARMGDLTRDDLTEHVSTALQMVLGFSGQPPDVIERQVAGFLGSVEEVTFGLRPSPREQRRYLARRLIQVVVDMPGPAHDNNPWDEVQVDDTPNSSVSAARGRSGSRAVARARTQVVGLGPHPDDPAPLDRTAACSECGAIGTVAVVARDVEPRVTRFCVSCWASARETYWMTFWTQPKPPTDRDTAEGHIATLEWIRDRMTQAARHNARYVASAMWEDRLPFLEASLRPNEGESQVQKERHLRMLANDLEKQAPNMHGAMPPAIESFVRQYASPASQPASASDKHEPPATSRQPDA